MRHSLEGSLAVAICVCLSGAVAARPAAAQDLAPLRQIEIDVREGTWMSVDVSPDGSRLVFDLLGDLYLIPSAGGEARRLTRLPKNPAANASRDPSRSGNAPVKPGQPVDVQPRFSPDGTKVVFVSDRDGADNVYVVGIDGSDLRQITFGRNMHTSPAWSRDGRSIAVRRVTARPNAFVGSAGELIIYRSEGGPGERLTTSALARDVSGMEFSADDASVYVAVPVDPISSEIPHGRTFQIKRFDRRTRSMQEVTDNFGGAVRPRVTPDGKLLAYATFDDGEMVLRLRDLATGSERIVTRGIEMSAVLGGLQLDALPGYAFSPDGRYAFMSYGGKIHRIRVADGATADVPFRVRTSLQVGPRNHFSQPVLEGRMQVRMLNWPMFAPDGKRAVFEAIGKVWVVSGGGGTARRLTASDSREYAPSISPDGRWVAYVTWSDSARGHLFKVPLAGGQPIRLTNEAGYYAAPSWSPDGSRIVLIVGGNADLRGLDPTQDQTRKLAWIGSAGGALHQVIGTLRSGGRFGGFQDIGAQFSRDGSRLWFVSGDGSELRSVAVDGSNERAHLRIANAQYQVPTYIAVSPDEKRVAFTAGNLEVWQMPMPARQDSAVVVNTRLNSTPGLTKISVPAGYAPRWVNDNEVSWAFGNRFFRRGTDTSARPAAIRVSLNAVVPAGRGVVALTGARLITMRHDEVIETGTIVIRENRIVDVGPSDAVRIPAGATVMKLDGSTIVPGLMDLHDHGFGGSAIRNWPEVHRKAAAKLAYGVTLSRDLSAPVQSAFSLSELINSGQMPGPRAYAAGEPVLPAIFEIRTLDDALMVVQMMKDLGAIVLKQYLQPTRYQRQLAATAARRLNFMITAEGGLDYKNNLTMLLDGYTATEHMWAPFPLYGDVGQLMARTGFFYTPTTGTSAAGSEHWFNRMAVDTDPKQQRFILHSASESLARRVKLAKIAPEWEPTFNAVVTSVNRLAGHGAKIGTGSHDVPTPSGLGLHWEMWSYVEGGMTPLAALRAATITGAETLGMSGQLGSLEKGKLADLIILKANPLKNIQNTLSISSVMRNGLLYDANTLAPVTK